jgi:tetratricopeptide (TPR) repeat protein
LQCHVWLNRFWWQQDQLRFLAVHAVYAGDEAMNATVAVAATFAAVLAIVTPHGSLAADENVPSDSCKIASGGIGSGGNTVTCNFGMPPEQLKAAIEAALNGHLIDRIVQISKTLGVTEDAAKTLLKIVGEDSDVPEDRLAEALGKAAIDYQRLQAQLAALKPDNPTAKALVEQAKSEINAGLLDHAHELLRQATRAQIAAAQGARKLKEQAQAAEDAQMLGAASSTAAEGSIAMTERRYQEAAQLFAQAADYVPAAHASERGGYLTREADALYEQGDQRGDNDALRSSIEVYGRALTHYPRPQVPFVWANIQVRLGIVLETLGERENGTTMLEEAVAADRAALEEYTRERVPLDWAGTQLNLGTALAKLGEREIGTEKLEQAVEVYREALKELARERVPLEWAAAQDNLGSALATLGEREIGTEKLEQAVQAYRAALEERTREWAPLVWAETQNNLGTALEALGERESGTARLEEAGAAFRAALEERTRERVPLYWAETQNNLGDALMGLGERETGTARLEQAVKAYGEALKEATRERVPPLWAASFGNQGVAMMQIADRTNDSALAETALKQIEAAYDALRDGGQQRWAADFELFWLPKAQAIRDRLKGK